MQTSTSNPSPTSELLIDPARVPGVAVGFYRDLVAACLPGILLWVAIAGLVTGGRP